jgi:hypothetical protein
MQNYPLNLQIGFIVLTALFAWTFHIARNPRQWRRWFQSLFSRSGELSVNKNKVIDEKLKRWGILIAMFILVADVVCFVAMVTHQSRQDESQLSEDERFRMEEQNKLQKSGTMPGF